MKILMSLAAVIMCISMLLFPKETYDAASMGLVTWWQVVFPSLLPFFIVSELFLGFGIVHLISILLEPVMRPVFNLPGCAAFVVALGYTSGFPVGAVLTATLRQEKLVTRREGERLIAFTNNASPLFLFVATAVGIFHRPSLGIILAIAHYGTNMTLGLLLRFLGQNDPEKTKEQVHYSNLLINGIKAMLNAQKKDGRPVGRLLGDAVRKSVHSLATIGGFIIFFAVIVRLLTLLGVTEIIVKMLSLVLCPLGFPHSLLTALSTGLFEMTLGASLAGKSAAALHQQVVAASMIIAWSGISIHAQVASMISDTDLSMLPFAATRIAHALLSGITASLLMRTQPVIAITAIPAWQPDSTINYVLISLVTGLVSLLIPICAVAGCFLLSKTTLLILRIKR